MSRRLERSHRTGASTRAAPRATRARVPAAVSARSGVALLYLAVAFGSMIGGTARWLASELMQGSSSAAFPLGTLFVNVTGSFLIGFYATLTAPDGRVFASARQRQLVMTGILGGYTTFSIFSFETLALLQASRLELAALNVGVSIVGWLAAVWAGHALAVRMNSLS